MMKTRPASPLLFRRAVWQALLPLAITAALLAAGLSGCSGGGGGATTNNTPTPSPSATATASPSASPSPSPSPSASASPRPSTSPSSTPAPVVLSVSPSSPILVDVSGQVAFASQVSGTANTGVTWTIDEPAGGGTITTGGVYQAPAVAGTFHVRAVSRADAAQVIVVEVRVRAASGVIGVQ